MIRRIDFLLPKRSQYHALHNFTEKIYEAFCRKGFTCRLLHPDQFFEVPVDDPPELTFGINGVPFDEQRRMLCDIISVPHFSYMIDPPYRFYETFTSPYLIAGCDDRYGCAFLQDLGVSNTYFFPHGTSRELCEEQEKERLYDAVMLASFIDHEALRREWQGSLPKIVSQVMDDAIDITFSDDKTSFMKAFALAYQDRLGLDKEPEKVGKDFIVPLMYLESYVKGKERTDLVKSMTQIPLLLFNGHIEGQPGWERIVGAEYPNITLHPSVSYEEGLQFMKQAKFVLNSFSKNKEGAHDRVFNGMACGALVVSNENIYLKEFFEDERDILFFKPNGAYAVEEKMLKVLVHEEQRHQMALRGREIVKNGHTWDHRVEDLIQNLPRLIEATHKPSE